MRADSHGFRRFVAAAVTSLLVADLAAVAVVVAADTGTARHGSAATATSAAPDHTLSVITTPDGQRLLADPSTARGQLAIRDAIDHGGTVSEISVPDTANGQGTLGHTPFTVPSLDVVTVPVGSILDRTIDSVLANAPTTTVALGGGSATTLPGSPLTSLLDSTQSTLTSTVSSATSTVSSVVGGVQTTVTSLVNQTQTTLAGTATTASSLLSGTVSTLTSTVSSLAQPVTTITTATTLPVSTTLAPAPVTTICTTLVHC